MKKTLIYFLLAQTIILSGCSSSGPQSSKATPPSVAVSIVNPSDEILYTEYPAKIEGQTDVEIRTQVAGILEKILVNEGDYVEKGTALFQVDPSQYREVYNEALGDVLATKASVTSAKLEVDKLKPLVENKVVSDYQIKAAQAAYEAALAKETQARAKAGNARITLGFTTIKAPESGFIGRLSKKTGSLLAPSDTQPLTYLSDNRDVHAYFSIGEADFVSFKEGLRGLSIGEKLKNAPGVTMILAGGKPYRQTGALDMVDAAFDKNTGAITLRATFHNQQGLLRSGNSGRIRLGLKHSGVIGIPQSATFEMQDKIFAFIVDENSKARQVALTISGASGNTYYLSGGLKSGDRLVLKGFESIKDGMEVKAEKSQEKLASN
ncbi:efflux RND transporter periplasmic adaptor subunit [Pedobacter miscanthi]|uniref:Efflux transporter periplasmic adaptor subunit n=1 Tax=Pedobacter miscanthi TaxID=2259170 RepID=A0A366LDF9_9SPHI|nr:efflux RND transporter periplasmic adaptor subunit [Pedobacter miscanthi]RBQ11529.1 efflux transporter periplasmic adaptor subunit [Pedobacter miscanthi]